MQLINPNIEIIDNILKISIDEGIKDNSIYEIRIKNIKSINGDILEDKIFKIYTKLSPLFVDIQNVKSLIDGCSIPDDIILYHIREASKFAEYIKGSKIDEDNVPFEITQFVRYKAALECLLRHTIGSTSSTGAKGQIGNVSYENKQSYADLSRLLKFLNDEIAKWLDEVKGFKLEGRAQMKTTVKGSSGDGIQKLDLTFGRGV